MSGTLDERVGVPADDHDVGGSPPRSGRSAYRRHRRRRVGIAVAVTLLVLGAATAAARGFGGTSSPDAARSELPPATVEVTRVTLTQTEQVSGTLGYGPATPVIARTGVGSDSGDDGEGGEAQPDDTASGGSAAADPAAATAGGGDQAGPSAQASPSDQGAAAALATTAPITTTALPTTAPSTTAPPTTAPPTTAPPTSAAPSTTTSTTSTTLPPTTNTLTWLPPVGAVVHPGEALFEVDDDPVVLVVGETPPYRLLADGVRGRDVETFEANLALLGYKGFTVDQRYTAKTADAVERWQHSLGVEETGTVDVDRIVVGPAAVRVAEHRAAVGADATGEVLAYTDTTRVVTVPLEVTASTW